ncbi:MAG: hypothetical protein Kow00111_04200 [Thermincola ferriacetica]
MELTISHLDKLLALLDRQTDNRLHPNLLVGYLGLVNLMSIMSFIHAAEQNTGLALPALNDAESTSVTGDEKNLKNAITSLMNSAGAGSGGPDLSSLFNMMGGNKKPNPQMLLTLMNLMNSMKAKADTGDDKEADSKDVGEKPLPGKTDSPDVKSDRRRGLL